MGTSSAVRRRRQRKKLWDMQAGRCFYCNGELNNLHGDDMQGTIDHVKPRCAGGGKGWDNIVLSCARCNSDKSDIPRRIWEQRRAATRQQQEKL